MKKRITWILATFVAMLICLRPASATVINVNAGGNIQSAIDQTVEGDTVAVHAGTWSDINIYPPQHAIVLLADPNVYINSGTAVYLAGSDTTSIMDGFHFTGFYGTAVTFHNGSGATLRNLDISSKPISGIFIGHDSYVKLENIRIHDCPGVAIWPYSSASSSWGYAKATASYFENNGVAAPALLPSIENGQLVYLPYEADRSANFGAVCYMSLGSGQMDWIDCYIITNSTNYLAGALYAGNTANTDTCFANMKQCTVIGNATGNEGSVFWGVGKHRLMVENCLFMNNNEQQQTFVGNTHFTGTNLAWPGNHGIIGALVADPLFCDLGAGYYVVSNSPCWPANNPSGNQIGAVEGVCTSVDTRNLPEAFQLTAYPNPFNPSTTIGFNLTRSGLVTLNIYDLEGRLVKTLLNDEQRPAGLNSVNFDANGMPTGTYFCRLETNGQTTTSKLLLVK